MPDIAFPVSSRPGPSADEGAGRLINAYAEEVGEGGRNPVSIRRAPGLVPFAETGVRGLRGARMSAGRLLAAVEDRLLGVEADGTVSDLGPLPGTERITLARNNRAPVPQVVAVTLLNGGREAVRPGQLAEETAEMVPEVAQAQRDGLRAEVDRLVGTKANDRVALADAVKGEGDWNRARMNTVFGEEPTAGLVGAVERERAFDASNQRIVNNSMTELRKRAADDLAPRSLEPGSGEIGTVVAGAAGGPAGIAAAQGVKGLKATANAMGREADIERNRQIAQAVTMIPGEALDALIAALGVRAQGSANAQNAGEAIELLTQALLQSQGERSRRIVPSGLLGQ